MQNMMMGSLDGNEDRVAFDVNLLEKIIPSGNTKILTLPDNSGAEVEVERRKYSLLRPENHNGTKPYLLLLRCGCAFNVNDYQLLFNVKRLPNNFVSGVNASGEEVLCSGWDPAQVGLEATFENRGAELEGKLLAVNETLEELKDLKGTFTKIKNGQFFESLAMELSGKIKQAAQEFIDFRNDIGKRIEPEIVRMAANDIPEASNQLEGINETLEESTMKIMDINEELTAVADECIAAVDHLLSKGMAGEEIPDNSRKILEAQAAAIRRMKSLSLNMLEPLSFQDLVGQRIQKIIRLVKSMEVRIEDMIISFGLKVKKHKEHPEKSFEDLRMEVEQYKSDLKGPQRQGEGMAQTDIDDLLATL